jgi:hypothetical protein
VLGGGIIKHKNHPSIISRQTSAQISRQLPNWRSTKPVNPASNFRLQNLSLQKTSQKKLQAPKPPNDQELSHAAGDLRQSETRSAN